jgi:hypothetical protein
MLISDPTASVHEIVYEITISAFTVFRSLVQFCMIVYILTICLRYFSWKCQFAPHTLIWLQWIECVAKFQKLFVIIAKAKKCIWHFLLSEEESSCWCYTEKFRIWLLPEANTHEVMRRLFNTQNHTYNCLEHKRNQCYEQLPWLQCFRKNTLY